MATIRVDVIGDSSSLKRALGEAGIASEKAGGQFTSLAKNMLGLAAGFLGTAGVVMGFEKTVKAAEALNVATRQLDAQLRTNGESVKAIAPFVTDLNSRFEKLGFTNADTEAAFTRLDRASGSARVAFEQMGVTADLARAKNISFSQAALLIGKVIDGNTSALNRYGIVIPKGTKAVEALAIAHQKLAGQAAASVTPMSQFSATITDIEAKIGNKLLPVINKYLEGIDRWLSKSANQKKITDAVADAVAFLQKFIGSVTGAVKTFLPYVQSAVDKLGGLKNVLVILGTIKVVSMLSGWSAALINMGAQASSSSGKVTGLNTKMKLLPALTVLTIELVGIELALKQLGGLKGLMDSLKNGPDMAANAGESAFVGTKYKGQFVTAQGGSEMAGILQMIADGTKVTASELKILNNAIKNGAAYATKAAALSANPGLTFLVKGGTPSTTQGVTNTPATGKLSQSQVYSLLIGAGFSPAAAKNFVGIAGAESGNRPSALNTNAATGDYSAGLFQENFYKNLGPARVAKYAPQFGLSGQMTPEKFAAWLLKHPDAQAKIAYQQSSGGTDYSPWAGDAFVKAHPELLGGGGGGGGGIPGSTDLPNMTGTKKAKKPPAFKIPQTLEAGIRKAQDAFKNDVSESHLDTLTALLGQEEKLLKAHGQLAKAASVGNEITDAVKKWDDAQQKLFDASFIKSLPAKLAPFTKKINADQSRYSNDMVKAQYDTGVALDGDFQDITTILRDQAVTLTAERAKLQGMLKGKDKTVKAAIQAHIKTVSSEIAKVASEALQNLQAIASALQQKVTQAKTDFEGALSALSSSAMTQLQSNLYGQYGVSGDQAALDAMQQADQMASLNDALAAAQKQLTADMVDGSGATQDQIDTDKKAVTAAQHAIDENNLSLKIAKEKTAADAAYLTQSGKLTTALQNWQVGVENGTASVGDLNVILSSFGLQFDATVTAPVVSSAQALAGELMALAQAVAKVTGSPIATSAVAPNLLTAAQALAVGGPYSWGIAGKLAGGGPTIAGKSYLVGERGPEIFTAGMSGRITPNGSGGGQTVVVNMYGPVGSEDQFADNIRRALLRKGLQTGRVGLS